MKPSYTFLLGCLFTLFLFHADIAFSQSDVTFDISATCENQEEGIIVATVVTEDYAPPFNFTWTDATGNPLHASQIDEDQEEGICTVSGLMAGTYCVTITSDDGCEASSCDVIVEELSTPFINSITPICACPAPGYGSAVAEVSGGSGEYDYTWMLVGEQWIHIETGENPQFPHLSPIAEFPDTYELTVTDLTTGCQATSSVEIGLCNGLNLASLIEVTPDCNEEGTSTISVQLPPGTGVGDFEFRWTKPGVGLLEFDYSEDGYASLVNAMPGEYCLNLITVNGCEETVCGIMVESMPLPVLTCWRKTSTFKFQQHLSL